MNLKVLTILLLFMISNRCIFGQLTKADLNFTKKMVSNTKLTINLIVDTSNSILSVECNDQGEPEAIGVIKGGYKTGWWIYSNGGNINYSKSPAENGKILCGGMLTFNRRYFKAMYKRILTKGNVTPLNFGQQQFTKEELNSL